MTLADLERSIIQGINPTSAPREQKAAQQAVNPGGKLTPEECLAVYRNNITSARVRALETIYPVCKAVLGEDCFRALARDLAWHTADTCADLNVYGDQFAAFLGARNMSEFSQLPYLRDLALLEWYWHGAYYAVHSKTFPYALFAEAADRSGQLCFTLACDLSLLETEYPVREIWRRHRAGENADSVRGLEGREYLCIHRTGHEPRVTKVNLTVYNLLEYIQKGYTLEQLGDIDGLSESLAELLPALIQRGWVSGFQLQNQADEQGNALFAQ